MKKLNKKGFTLVELLAVVVILLAISVIAVSSISAAIERNKEKQTAAKIEIIISYAKLYYDEHKNSETDQCIETSKLNLTENESKDANDNDLTGIVKYNNTNRKWEFIANGHC